MVAVAQMSWNDHQTYRFEMNHSHAHHPLTSRKNNLRFELDEAHHVLVVGCRCVLCFRFSAGSEVFSPLESGDVYGVLFEKCGTPTPKVLGLEPLKCWLPSSGSPFPGSDLFRFHVKLQGLNILMVRIWWTTGVCWVLVKNDICRSIPQFHLGFCITCIL